MVLGLELDITTWRSSYLWARPLAWHFGARLYRELLVIRRELLMCNKVLRCRHTNYSRAPTKCADGRPQPGFQAAHTALC